MLFPIHPRLHYILNRVHTRRLMAIVWVESLVLAGHGGYIFIVLIRIQVIIVETAPVVFLAFKGCIVASGCVFGLFRVVVTVLIGGHRIACQKITTILIF